MAKFKVLSPVDHDNKRVEPGGMVELDEATAGPLLAVGAVEAVSLKTVDPDGDGKPDAPSKGRGK